MCLVLAAVHGGYTKLGKPGLNKFLSMTHFL